MSNLTAIRPATGVAFYVHGTPAPQGSKKAFVVNGRPVLTESSKNVKPWREDVRQAGIEAMNGRAPFDGPLSLSLTFFLLRPKSVTEKQRPHPIVKPDLDKLTRAVMDALTSAGVYRDDSLVVDLVTVKRYADSAGVAITVREVTA